MRNDAANIDADHAENRLDHFRKLAEIVWNKKSPNQYGSEILSYNSFKETFNASAEEVSLFNALYNIHNYNRF